MTTSRSTRLAAGARRAEDPGDPQVTDWGALVAAVARHRAALFGVPVHDSPHARAAALLQLPLHAPALDEASVRDIEREPRQWTL
ncbi:hypothetical protein ACFV20_18815 [Streptomyces sp. NPDC059696]|uniref:hypothetical protein n=1 Tax=Streptomyces sp. NPDC059696 TaxID=3346911 RepID=UPI0036CE9A98